MVIFCSCRRNSAYKFTPNADYPYYKIGDVEIFQISVLVHQGRIFEININIKKDKDIFDLLKYRYGNYTDFRQILLASYSWETKDGIVCELTGYGNVDERLELNNYILRYIDNPYWKILKEKEDQKKKFIKVGKENELKKQAKTQF